MVDPAATTAQAGAAAALPTTLLGVDGVTAAAIVASERAELQQRRAAAGASGARLTGLALSGGGIRSATFALGVLQALAQRGFLREVDYLSTVSGGGYLGAWLSAFVDRDTKAAQLLDARGTAVAALRNRCVRHLLGSRPLRNALQAAVVYLGGLLRNTSVAVAVVALALLARWHLAVFTGSAWRAHFWPVAGVATAVLLLLAVRLRALRWFAAGALLLDATAAGYQLLAWTHTSIRGRSEHWLLGLAIALVVAAVTAIGLRRPRAAYLLLNVIAASVVPIAAAYAYFTWLPCVVPEPGAPLAVPWWLLAALAVALFVVLTTNVNQTSSHRFYRERLCETFLTRVGAARPERRRLGELSPPGSPAPYHLLQATVNLPGSDNPALRGRRGDVFVFSKHWCGSAATGYAATAEFERRDARLDLGTAMAISGAAMSSLMGAYTQAASVPLLTFLNLRLGYWLPNVRDVGRARRAAWSQPNLLRFIDELFRTASERGAFLNVSDGGHLENLGLFELLRRQCELVVAVDASADPQQHCRALIDCMRRADVDLGVHIDIDLAPLRAGADGSSAAHQAIGTITYPDGRRGRLLYVKASCTGDESPAVAQYRREQPSFPHESTLDQAFDEEQFEAYRALGEHIGAQLPPFDGEAAAAAGDEPRRRRTPVPHTHG